MTMVYSDFSDGDFDNFQRANRRHIWKIGHWQEAVHVGRRGAMMLQEGDAQQQKPKVLVRIHNKPKKIRL